LGAGFSYSKSPQAVLISEAYIICPTGSYIDQSNNKEKKKERKKRKERKKGCKIEVAKVSIGSFFLL
jgi:hypothetical protein